MVDIVKDLALLQQFEAELDPRHPERSSIPTRVLGYGEMSTTMEIGGEQSERLAYKRMPMFENEEEAKQFEQVYWAYVGTLEGIGIRVVPSEIVILPDERHGRHVIYLIQERLPADVIGDQVIRRAAPAEARKILWALLELMGRAFRLNRERQGGKALGFDGQISNWAIFNFNPERSGWQESLELVYFDTGSPLLRLDGEEQLSPELYLRAAPSFLAWILRRFFMDDVVDRYYDFRLVIVDLLGNLYKEGRGDLVPELVETANQFLFQEMDEDFEPLKPGEVKSYYRQDAWIWRLYLGFRRIDRELHWLSGKYYPYVLPGLVKR